MTERYWLVHPNGGRQLIDPRQFDLDNLALQAQKLGARLVIEPETPVVVEAGPVFEPPVSALGPLFRMRFERIFTSESEYVVDMNVRPTVRVLGGYYKRRRLVRVYTHDRATGRRPMHELFDTFLHEMAHHLEYTQPHSFNGATCGRVPGRMHSQLFWHILGELKYRWVEHQRKAQETS